jgi:hypothetical protein
MPGILSFEAGLEGGLGTPCEIKQVKFGGTTWEGSNLDSDLIGEFLQFKRSVNIGPQAPAEAKTVHIERTSYLP